MFSQKLKYLFLACLNSAKSVQKDQEIKILCLVEPSNKNHFLLKNLIDETTHQLIFYGTSKQIESYCQQRQRSYQIIKKQEDDFKSLAALLKKQKFDLVIGDYFLEDLANPAKSMALQQNLILPLSKKIEFIFPFAAISYYENLSEILINLPSSLINFDEILERNQSLIDEALKGKNNPDLTRLNNLCDQTTYLEKNLDSCARYLITHTSSTNILNFLNLYHQKISHEMLLHLAADNLLFCPQNDVLFDQLLQLANASETEIIDLIKHNFNKLYNSAEPDEIDLGNLKHLLKRFSPLIKKETKEYLLDNCHRVNFFNERIFSFLVNEFHYDAAESAIRMMKFNVEDYNQSNLYTRLHYIIKNHQLSISDLNRILFAAKKNKKNPEIFSLLIDHGANKELLNDEKNYGWMKLDSSDISSLAKDFIAQNFATYVATMNDFLFDESYGYYASGIVKIGGHAADFSTNVTNGKGFAFLLALSAAQKWQEVKKPQKFIILELCGGNGKLANDILTIIETLSKNIAELAGFFDAVIYRTVDISAGLSKVQQKRNKKFTDLKKFEVILSDASDKKWLEKFEFKNHDGIIFCNELVDQFIPDFSIVRSLDTKVFKPYAINYLLVNNFADFYQLYNFQNEVLLDQESAKKIYEELEKSSQEFKKKFKELFAITCADENLIISKNDFREKIILPLLKPRLDRARSLRYKLFELEEEIEERKRNFMQNFQHLEIEIEFLIEEIELLKKDLLNIWQHFVVNYLVIPAQNQTLEELDFKYARSCEFYPDGYKIAYHETQLKNLLDIIHYLKKYEFLIFEYGKLPNEEEPRTCQYYGFSYLLDGADLHYGIQKNIGLDIYSKLFLGIDITLELDFPKIEEMARIAGLNHIGIYGDQKIIDDHLRKTNLNLYKKSLEVLKANPDFNNLKDEITNFRNYHPDFKVMSLGVK